MQFYHLRQGENVYTNVGWFVCLSVDNITGLKKLPMNVHEIYVTDSPWDKEQLIRFWGDLHSDYSFFAYFQYVK